MNNGHSDKCKDQTDNQERNNRKSITLNYPQTNLNGSVPSQLIPFKGIQQITSPFVYNGLGSFGLWNIPPPPICYPPGNFLTNPLFQMPGMGQSSFNTSMKTIISVESSQNVPYKSEPLENLKRSCPFKETSQKDITCTKRERYPTNQSPDYRSRSLSRSERHERPSRYQRSENRSNRRSDRSDRFDAADRGDRFDRAENRSERSNDRYYRVKDEKISQRRNNESRSPHIYRSFSKNDYSSRKDENKSVEQLNGTSDRWKQDNKFNSDNEISAQTTSKQSRSSSYCDSEPLLTKSFSWIRCSPAEPYYIEYEDNTVKSSNKLKELQNRFERELVQRAAMVRESKPPFTLPPRKTKLHPRKHIASDSSCSSDDSEEDEDDTAFEELQRKKLHPWRLHDELWYNDPGEMNDGPLCRCSAKARRSGIRHGIYPGEEELDTCDPDSNNRNRLFHYRLNISPLTNYTSKFPTVITHDNHQFSFEGFSILAHYPISNFPPCKLIRFNIEYTITLEEEKFPVNFCVRDLQLVTDYIFIELLELVDLNWKSANDTNGCPRFHLFPRFSRILEDDGKELLSMNVIMQYLLSNNLKVVDDNSLDHIQSMSDAEWIEFAKEIKGMIVTYPGAKPCSVRVDQIDREQDEREKEREKDGYPVIVHFGIRPPQLSYAGNPKYQKAWRDYVKFRHLLANKPKVSYCDRQTLLQKEEKLQEMRMKNDLKRDVTVVISSKGFYRTGLLCDVIQHALLLPVVLCHLRFHQSLAHLEKIIGYKFKDRYLLQLALTHPSYRENFGTNPDHARNSLTNCGMRQPYYGDRRVHFMNTRKRGINMLINIMSRFGCPEETASNINHNERLEFLGDAVVEFLSSIHLYFMFPDLEEGGLATYRAAIVQNQHLAVLAKKLQLEKFMLYAHGSDLCHDLELRHAMANCFEALMGALFLDGDIDVADKVFSNTLFLEDKDLYEVWVNYGKHPIQEQEPEGDRHYLATVPRLKELHGFETLTGIQFTHIRLLARAFTHRSVGYNNLTLGSNQRMEFLGDTVLQLVASEYLYKYFPQHHEGHLSLLRSSLVNNKTQAVVCDDLAMTSYAQYNYAKGELKTKDRADLLEAFLGALYVDKGLTYCQTFCQVCFFPRLEHFILNQDWNDPKSKLQQCCLTLRSIDGGEPDIPIYKVIESLGPTNTRVYKVAVYFRNKRLATGKGHSIQEAEMDAAANALQKAKGLFPQLNHQKRMIERSKKQQEPISLKSSGSESPTSSNFN